MLKNYFNFLQKKSPPGFCGLYLLPDKLMMTHVLFDRGKPVVTFCDSITYELDMLAATLASIIKKHALQGMACSWILHDSFYRLFLLDPPAIPEKEVPLALRWQVKELIDFPAEEAVIEYFPVPATLASRRKIFVTVAKKTQLQAVVDIINNTELNLKYVDIGELALRNITALYNDDQCYLGLLIVNKNHIDFIITHEKNLLLTRRLPPPEIAETGVMSPQWLEAFKTEIQNSFSYCKGQQQQEGMPAKLLISTSMPDFVEQFSQVSQTPPETLRIRKKIDFEFIIPSDNYLSAEYLMVMGGALRGRSSHP